MEIRIEDAISGENYIELDEDWRVRASSYISHIRDVVSKAEVGESIRGSAYLKDLISFKNKSIEIVPVSRQYLKYFYP
jgi:hypothetical protein